MPGAEVRNIVGANHQRHCLGVEPAGALPILQPPQQVHRLVTGDAGHEGPAVAVRASVQHAARVSSLAVEVLPQTRARRATVCSAPTSTALRAPAVQCRCGAQILIMNSLWRRQAGPRLHVAAVPVAGVPAHALPPERLHDAVAVHNEFQALPRCECTVRPCLCSTVKRASVHRTAHAS